VQSLVAWTYLMGGRDEYLQTRQAMSTVRENLLTRRGYTPYCGNQRCLFRMPRTIFNGTQFACQCGWRSSFEPEFIERYKAAQTTLASGVSLLDDKTVSPDTLPTSRKDAP
jgi:hypothetical protein